MILGKLIRLFCRHQIILDTNKFSSYDLQGVKM